MIYVDPLREWGAPWRGGVSCHMTSDTGAEELKSFAASIGLTVRWFQPKSHPHFDLSPRWRAKAIAAGARPVTFREYLLVVHRARAGGAQPGLC